MSETKNPLAATSVKGARSIEEIRASIEAENPKAAPEYKEGIALLVWCAEQDFFADQEDNEPTDLPGSDEGEQATAREYLLA